MKKCRGNITILVLFIMIASSLMGLLAMYFVRQLVGYSGLLHNYYQSYYISKAGLELGLVEANIHTIGLNSSAGSGDSIITENIQAPNCYFEMKLLGKMKHISETFWLTETCNQDNALQIVKGESMMFPLFVTSDNDSHFQIVNDNNILIDQSILINLESNPERILIDFIGETTPNLKLNIGILTLTDEQNLYEHGYFFQSKDLNRDMISEFLKSYAEHMNGLDITIFNKNFTHYLLIANPNDDTITFCLDTVSTPFAHNGTTYLLSTPKYFIRSIAHCHDSSLSLEAEYRQGIPSFLIDLVGEFTHY